MAETAVEPQAAAPELKIQDSKPTEATTGGAEKSNDSEENKNHDDQHHPKRRESNGDRRGSRDDGDRRDNRNGGRDNRDRWQKDGGRNDRRGGGRGGQGRGGGRGGKSRGRGSWNRQGRNVRTKYERQAESDDAGEIRRQVEFYFSDSNLPIDKFLLTQIGGSENKPFPLKTIHDFKRMRHFQPFSAIVEAVKGSDFLKVNDKDEVYRKEPLDSKFTLDTEENNKLLTNDNIKRSIYAKGFGDEKERTGFEIEEFFQPYGVRSVRLRRMQDGTFKGSVFVEFENEDAAKQFLEMEDKPKFNDKELKIMSKKAYIDEKAQGIIDGTVKPKSPRSLPSKGGRGGRGDRDGYKRKRNHDDDADEDVEERDNWRERRNKFQKQGSRDQARSRSRSPSREEKKESEPEEKKSEEVEKEIEGKEGVEVEKEIEGKEGVEGKNDIEVKEAEKTEA